MVFNSTAYYWLIFAGALVSGLGIVFLLRVIQKKNPEKRRMRGTSGLFVFGICWLILYNKGTDVLVLHKGNYEQFVVIGNDYMDVAGRRYDLTIEDRDYTKFILNKTGKPLVFETKRYGKSSILTIEFDGVDLLQPNELEVYSDFPDYYPWETPPGSVKVSKYVGSERKEWVRYATKAEISKAGEEQDQIYYQEP